MLFVPDFQLVVWLFLSKFLQNDLGRRSVQRTIFVCFCFGNQIEIIELSLLALHVEGDARLDQPCIVGRNHLINALWIQQVFDFDLEILQKCYYIWAA